MENDDTPGSGSPPEPEPAPVAVPVPGNVSVSVPVPVAGAAPAPALPRPRATSFAVVLIALFPLGLVLQALQPPLGLVWTELFVFLVPAAALAARAGLDPVRFLRLGRPPPGALALAALLGGLGFLAGGAVMALWAALLPRSLVDALDLSKLFDRPGWEQVAVVMAASVLAPICEEAAFRGHLLSAQLLRHRPGAAIGVGAIFFAALHVDPVRFPALVLLGLLYGWLAWRAGSIWPAVVAHAVNNGTASALALASGRQEAGAAEPAPLASAAVLAAALALLVPLLRVYARALPAPPPPDAALLRRPAPARWIYAAVAAGAAALVAIAALPRR